MARTAAPIPPSIERAAAPPRLRARRFRQAPLRQAPWRIAALAAGLVAALALTACTGNQESLRLYGKAKTLWENGQHVDAARTFITLSELHPDSPLVEDALYWAASLYHQFLDQPDLAERYYQQVMVQFPDGQRARDALEALAELYADDEETRYKAILSYRKLLDVPALEAQHPYYRLRIGEMYLRMGRLAQARFELRQFLEQYPGSELTPRAYYLVGFSYYWEDRKPLAVIALNQLAKEFPGHEMASRAQFFVGEIYEEAGMMRRALSVYESLKGAYHNPAILKRRIDALQARMGRSVR